MTKIRVRFGLKLVWPITNASVFVLHMDSSVFAQIQEKVSGIKFLLEASGRKDIADRIICEIS